MIRLDQGLASAAFDAIDSGLIVVGANSKVLAWNPWMEAASGLAMAEVIGRSISDIFGERVTPRFERAIRQTLELGASGLLTHSLHGWLLPLRTHSGQQLLHNISLRPLGSRPELGCLLQIIDVTGVAGRERVLRERQNARYDAVVGGAPDAILTLDGDGIIQLANPAAAREFGYEMTELVGSPMSFLLADDSEWEETFRSVLAGQTLNRPLELVARRRNGSPSYLEASASRWLSDGRAFVTAILRDVNERRMAVDALRRLNRTLERRVEERTADRNRMWTLSTDLMVVGSRDGVIGSINPAWHSLLGWEEREVVGKRLIDFVVEGERDRVANEIDSLLRGAKPRLIESGMLSQDGAVKRIAWSAVAAGDLLQAVGRDVTAEREAGLALRTAEEALRHSQKMEAIGQLTGGIAHDFNNILTAIIGSMEVLRRRIAAKRYDDLQSFMDGAISSANRAASLTHRLLAFARRQPLDPKPVEVRNLIGGMQDLIGRSLSENIKLRLDLSPGLWPALTDAHQLENAILNLAINARDAMPRGGTLTIAASNETIRERQRFGQDEIEPGDYVAVTVRDTGIGMSADTLARVFEPFYTTKPLGQGTGLGLSMIYGFAKQSRGHVRLDSIVGQGTTFRLFLPRYNGDVRDEHTPALPDVASGDGERVLVVEDDASVRLIIADVLLELGYSCLQAGDGQAALPILASNTPIDLLITDVGLPGINGRQLADIARQHRPELKILFVTGYAEHATGSTPFLAAGMEMVTKPFALDALALKIREMVTR